MAYTIEFRPSVLKAMKKMPRRDVLRIKKKIDTLCVELPCQSLTKLKGKNPFHRIRSGNYRIIYEIHEKRLVILVVKVGHRKDIYARLF